MIYQGENLKEISFPIGGIGTGSIGLAGNGHLTDWEIFNRPNKGKSNGHTGIGIRAERPDGTYVLKMLEGDLQKDFCGQQGNPAYACYGFGANFTPFAGAPHFKEITFDGRFPIAALTFRDPDFPAEVVMTAFNPLIPLDSENSSIPAAFFDLKVTSHEDNVKYTVVFILDNPFEFPYNTEFSVDGAVGVTVNCGKFKPDEIGYGDITLMTDAADAFTQETWMRGWWTAGLVRFYNEFHADSFLARKDTVPTEPREGRPALVGTRALLNGGESKNFRFVLTWNVPNNYNDWEPYRDEDGNYVTWKNYYATKYENSRCTAEYSLRNFDTLMEKTITFRDLLHGSTLDPAVIDAASSTLSVLKSSTVWRLEDGTFYGWEGVSEHVGACEGTCVHVWSYAYALCFLFPDLERTMRRTEFTYDQYPHGGIRFRTVLPLGRPQVPYWRACADGQFATVIKCYREWKISGDNDWLRDNWESIRKTLAYAWTKREPDELDSEKNIDRWDTDHDGVLEGQMHHTLDLELFGPSSWLEGMYLAALKAGAAMADELGYTEDAAEFRALFRNGYEFTKENLFNGEYFNQKIDLTDKSVLERFNMTDFYWNNEVGEIQYQIADGSEIDQMLGQWHAVLCGLGDIFDPEQRKTALRSMMRYNFKPSMREVENRWRVFALNDEAGTIMCDYPHGKQAFPISYCEECMTGFEYAFAGLLISEGMIDEGLTVIRAVRDRYDGVKRNPYNEIECGSNYARAMASFGLLPIFSGFSYDLPHGKIGFAPLLPGEFRCLWSLGTGWGEFYTDGKTVAEIRLAGGELTLGALTLGSLDSVMRVTADGEPISFSADGHELTFAPVTVTDVLRIEAQA